MGKANRPPILRGDEWRRAHPPESRRGGRPQSHIKIGTRFGKLVVVEEASPENRRSRSVCRCDCGNTVVVTNVALRSRVKSCGCLLSESHEKHGGCRRRRRNRLYIIWSGMKARCENPNSKIYKHYGGRGISICGGWRNDYAAFRDWALSHGYKDNLSIDRIDNNGNYEPSNCRWTTQKAQCANRRSCITVEINGKAKSVAEWCKEFGTPEKLARSRMSDGKMGVDIFVPPYRKKGGSL